MESRDTTTQQSKMVTVEVPEDRLAEFYAFYARFLAGRRGRRGPGMGHRHGHGHGFGHGHGHGPGGCRGRGSLSGEEAEHGPTAVREV